MRARRRARSGSCRTSRRTSHRAERRSSRTAVGTPPGTRAAGPPPLGLPRGHTAFASVPPYAPRRPLRRRGDEPQAARPRRVRPSPVPGDLRLAAARPPGARQDRGDHPRRDGRSRCAGGPAASAPAA
ncbi:conserved exported hypothetical protein [Curtobacterium sp. 8I-2]|nr:conserved exported hypothetical protein [Curtobacterium sp. 8I-2]